LVDGARELKQEEEGLVNASDLKAPLSFALQHLREQPEYVCACDSPNGWGTWFGFMRFVAAFLKASFCSQAF
jgi:hypothetical protein